ncbi:MAG: serine hydrolase [Acidobacteria bacterium]|nr:serine hydrolase [Acidobacteriota bacterium]
MTGTVPDLLRWAKSVDDGRVLSKESIALMYTPVTTKNGRYVGPNDGRLYYTLGWMLFPINGQLVIENNGGQSGTNTELIRIPSKNMTMAFASNIQMIDRMVYLRRLYELITDDPNEIRIFATNDTDRVIIDALDTTFGFGAINFERTKKDFTTEQQELARAFAYFNRVTNRDLISAEYKNIIKAIDDGRHSVAEDPFIKVGSYISMRLHDKYGAEYCRKYSRVGPIPFFADYLELYKADSKFPRELRFNETFERMISKWNQDWMRTWNGYTQHLKITAESDFSSIGEKLRPLFAKAEVYPNFIDQLLANQDGVPGMKASKLTVELYPESARANGNWGLFLMLINQSDERREYFRKNIGEPEPAIPYFKKSLELQSDGFASPRVLGGIIMRNWLNAGRLDDTLTLINLALELHPKEAQFHGGLCDVYSRKGMKEKAMEACKKALEIDPNFAPATELMKKLGI